MTDDLKMKEAIKEAKKSGERNEAYETFEEKFKPKLTTDDCFTPPAVYEAVKNWAVNKYGWQGRPIIRPFYPGGDFENYKYPENCVVIDNPPFSILAKIKQFYYDRKIDFFLFAPHLVLFTSPVLCKFVVCGSTVEFDNGAKVNVSFVCSQGPLVSNAPDLKQTLDSLLPVKRKPKYHFPDNVLTVSRLSKWAKYGIPFECDNAYCIRALDAQKHTNKTIYGNGFLISDAKAADAKAADAKAADVKAAAGDVMIWGLSEREKEIIRELDEKKK